MRRYLGAVDAAPDEGISREGVEVRPCHLGGIEILDIRFLHDLRDCAVVAERIGQPECIGGITHVFTGEALTVEELTNHRFAAGDVAVTFDPDTAVRFVTTLGNLLLDAFKNVGVILTHPVKMQSRGLNEGVFGIDIHQVERLGIRSCTLADGFVNRPQPCRIHVGMTDHADLAAGSVAALFLLQSGCEDFGDLCAGFEDFFLSCGKDIADQVRECFHDAFVCAHRDKVFTRQTCDLQCRCNVKDEVADDGFHDSKLDAVITVLALVVNGFVAFVVGIRPAFQTRVTCVAFQRDFVRFACLCGRR